MTSCRDVTGMRSSKGNHPQMDCFRYDQVSAFSLVSHMEWCASNMWNFGIWLENCGMQPSLCKPWFCCFKLITTDKGWSPPQPRWWHIYLYEPVLNVGEHSNIIISLYNILSKDTIFAKWIHGGMAIPAAIRSCGKLLEVMFNGETVGLGIPQIFHITHIFRLIPCEAAGFRYVLDETSFAESDETPGRSIPEFWRNPIYT